ncbi:excinuclease ABC subunit B [Candidatus Aerophobetes bacterium]|uniref:UvrABC system protein B n=1 Tax=Aerophobetes bacterium TaxID=2030807 RepID=A0A2A4WZ55_UNCAE|nr:MAG: excinuclease ABC subunit B [Candidatus Aerophobetes bacterium]
MFELKTNFTAKGDQGKAVEHLVTGLNNGKDFQVLLGITGSGKTFTMASVIAKVGRPALILAHNKTLAAQLYQEFKAFFPNNAVEYFVSYYDYYQPEAYLARTDTYIEKDMAINDTIDRLRLRATCSLLERKDVIIVSSVSCIYGLGMPEYYKSMRLELEIGKEYRRDDVLLHLIQLQYERNDFELSRRHFRVRGDVLEIVPAYEDDLAYRIEFFGDTVELIREIDPLTGKTRRRCNKCVIYPGSHHVTPDEVREEALERIRLELDERSKFFQSENLLVEDQRIKQRTRYDMEMIKEIGHCKGVENYSRHFAGRGEGEPPSCLFNYFPKDYLLFVDESHQTLPQVRAMYNGDRARKKALIDFGFRLPSAYDNRPLKFEEFFSQIHQAIFVSATPSPFEIEAAKGDVVEQIIRPTGLLDPVIEIRKAEGQVDDVLDEIRIESEKGGRILVTTLTKKLAEDLSEYLQDIGVRAKYMHSDIDTLERIEIIKGLRLGTFDVLVGINLLREGLDIPEVTLVAILDADKEGFLRSETALIQTCGRASRNVNGRVIMYANKETKSIKKTVETTTKRRKIQDAYNKEHGIIPTTVIKSASLDSDDFLMRSPGSKNKKGRRSKQGAEPPASKAEKKIDSKLLPGKIEELKKAMVKAAEEMDFEKAATLRDEMHRLEKLALL